MKVPMVLGMTVEMLSALTGFEVKSVKDSRISPEGSTIYIEIMAVVDEKELANEQVN